MERNQTSPRPLRHGSDFPPENSKGSASALAFYETEGGAGLADRFFTETEEAAEAVLKNPQGYHFIEEGLPRVSLKSFPYHFIFEETLRGVRFLVLRHDKRHPSFGLRRR